VVGCGSGWVVVVGLEFERVSVEKRVSPLTLRSASGSVEMTASGVGCGSGWVVVVGLEFERGSVEKRVSPLALRSASGSVEMTAFGVGCGLGWVVVVGSGCERGSVEKRVSPRLGGFGARWGSGWACGWCGGSSRTLLRGGRGCRNGCRRRRCGGIGSVSVGWRRSFCPSPRGYLFWAKSWDYWS
jgi:hypothetical protein